MNDILSADDLGTVKLLNFEQHGDSRGQMVVIEESKNIPFEMKRIFYIYGSDSDVVRGEHANMHSEFVLVNVSGTSKIKIRSATGKEQVYELSKPYEGVYIPKLVWKEMYDFSEDSVLLCIASEKYDPSEYIRSYNDYVELMGGQ